MKKAYIREFKSEELRVMSERLKNKDLQKTITDTMLLSSLTARHIVCVIKRDTGT